MADISKITLPSGSTYDLKDATARSEITTLKNTVTGAMHYIGVTTSALSDGATTNPIKINNADVTAKSGDVAIYNTLEFVFSDADSKWHEFGSTGSLKALAFKDSASASYTPAGTVSQPTFTGSSTTSTGKFTPSGTVSVSTNATTNKTATVSAAASGTATYTPAGTVSQPTFTGSATTSTGKFTPAGTNTGGAVTLNTTTVNSITAVGTLPTCTLPSMTATVSNENLTLGWSAGSFSAGTLPTKGANTTVATSVKAFTQPTFTGAEGSVSVSGTPSGTVSAPTFTGTGARLVTGNIAVPNTYTATFTGTEGSVTVSGTPSGTVSNPTFSGTKATITVN